MVDVRGKRSFEEFSTGVREPPSSCVVNDATSNMLNDGFSRSVQNLEEPELDANPNPNPAKTTQELGFSEGVLSEGDEARGGTRTVEIDESAYQYNEYNDFDQPVLTEVEDQNPDLDHDDPFENLGNEASSEDARAAGPVYSIVVNPGQDTYTGTSDEAILLKWHYRLGHVNMRTLLRVAPGIPGMEELCKIHSTCKIPTCKACSLGKLKAKPLPKA
eukprot:2084660-Rhodomonas_salina.1